MEIIHIFAMYYINNLILGIIAFVGCEYFIKKYLHINIFNLLLKGFKNIIRLIRK